jgi:uncharacterized repeat protein (TIGR03803 family)
MHRHLLVTALAGLLAAAPAAATPTYTVLYNLTGIANGGGQTPAGLALVNGALYAGSANVNVGGSVLLRVSPLGRGGAVLTTVNNAANTNGAGVDTLMKWGANVIGITVDGGARSSGSFFLYNPVRKSLSTFYSFTGGSDGAEPLGAWTRCHGAFYGVTTGTPNVAGSTVYKVAGPDVTSIKGVLPAVYTFQGGADGAQPLGPLACSGTTVYGATASGGTYSQGTLFSLDLATGIKTTLHHFGASGDAQAPTSSPVLYDGALYGAVQYRGPSGYGVIYKYTLATGAYSYAHTFGYTDGGWPGSIVLSQNMLYGITGTGQANKMGSIYALNLTSGGLTTLHAFDGTDGAFASLGQLLLVGNTLYGSTFSGGTHSAGVVFKQTVN